MNMVLVGLSGADSCKLLELEDLELFKAIVGGIQENALRCDFTSLNTVIYEL